MMRKIRQTLYWFGMFVGISILIWQIVQVFRTLGTNRLPFLSPGFFILAWIILVLLIYLQMLNWQQILFGSGRRLRMMELVRGYTLSLIPRYIPGSIWGFISRGEWLYQTFQIPYRMVNFSSVMEVLVTVVSSIMVIGFYFTVSSLMADRNLMYLLVFVVLLPILVWLLIDRLVHLVIRGDQDKNPKGYALKNIPLFTWLSCILIYIVQWVVLGGAILLINGAFYPGKEALFLFTPTNLHITTYAFSFAWLVGFLILFVPGGIGVRELILSSLIFSNLPVSFSQAAMVALFSRALYIFAEVFWITTGLIIDIRVKRRTQA